MVSVQREECLMVPERGHREEGTVWVFMFLLAVDGLF